MHDEVDFLIKENEKLKKENKYLKRLLEENDIHYAEIREVENVEYTKDEKIKIYTSYFKGRNDIFAERYFRKSDNQKGYSPVCRNKYSINCDLQKYARCKGCPHKDYYGMSNVDLLNHFRGKKSYGIYPMLDGDECYFLAVDFDEGDFFKSAINFKNICIKYGIDCAVEISQSGLGAHVWIFFEQPVKAKNARKIGDFILNKAFVCSNGISLKSFDRFFPSQDLLEKGGYGNLIALPLDGSLISEGKTVFVDDNKLPYENQIAFLSSVKKLTVAEVEILLEKIKQANEIDILPKNVTKNLQLKSSDFLDKVVVYYNNDLQISKNILSTKAMKYMMRLGSVVNNEFYDKQRMRQSTYNTPRVWQLFKEEENFINIPRGCLKDLILIFEFLKIEYEIIDRREEGQEIEVELCKNLRSDQETALVNIMCEENGVFVAPPGFGKTVIAAALISEYKRNTLVLVNNVSLIDQWKERLNEFLQVNYEYKKEKDKFGVYYGAKKKLTGNIDIASIHSFDDSVESNEILSKYGMIIVDEVHHLAARTFERVLRNTNTKYIYGLTATPKRSDRNEKIIYKTIGDIIYEHQNTHSELSKILIPKITNFRLTSKDKLLSYVEQCNKLVSNEERNKLIIEDIKTCILKKKNIILLSERIEHIRCLYEKISEFCNNVYIINGQMKMSEKKEVSQQISNICEDGYIILATGKYIGEGFDLPSLNTLFITMPFKWEGTLSQYVGRIHRTVADKTEVCVYDYVDLKVPMFSKMFGKRLRSYKKHNYKLNNEFFGQDTILFDKNSYKPKLIEDIRCAKKEIVLLINNYDVRCLSNIIIEAQDLCIRILSLNNFEELNVKDYNVIIEKCNSNGNAIIIDGEVIWYGDINPFKENIYDDSIMRIDDEVYAKEIILEVKNQ